MRTGIIHWSRIGIAVLLGVVGVSIATAPASASASEASWEAQSETTSTDVAPIPDGVSQAEWSTAVEEAQADYGSGDLAYLEAIKSISPLLVNYCHERTVTNVIPPGIYQIPTSSSASPRYNCVMESGLSNNPAVEVLQRALNYCYGASLAVDGGFGPATYSALMAVQSHHGIGVDGIYGPTTRSVLLFPGSSGCLTIAQIQSY